MKLYYTGADSNEAKQIDKDKSLGGYKSSTGIDNDLVSNLFGEVSMYGLSERLRETRALILNNDLGSDITNLTIHFDKLVGAVGTFEVASVTITPNAAGEVKMEKIESMRSTPFTGNFTKADGELNKQTLKASFTNGSYLGLWFRRTLSKEDVALLSCDTLADNYINEVETVTVGQVDIVLSWD